MSIENSSSKYFYKIQNEKEVELKKKINPQKLSFEEENNRSGGIVNEKLDEKIKKDNNNNGNNNYLYESNFNNSTFMEYFNYYLSYFVEQDFIIEEKDEPKNAGFFARIFGNYFFETKNSSY